MVPTTTRTIRHHEKLRVCRQQSVTTNEGGRIRNQHHEISTRCITDHVECIRHGMHTRYAMGCPQTSNNGGRLQEGR